VLALQFPLPDANYIKAKMPMYLVYPRSDDETQSHARHRWAHPNMPYEIPIGIQGGAWPFKYEIITAPTGATIGQYYGDDNYGVVTWTPSANSGTELFTVKITDQELRTIHASWSVTIDADQFVFIQDGWTGTKNGTIDSPLESFSDWYKGDRADDTYHNKIIVFRGGNYTAYGAAATNGNVRLDTASKTPSLIGYPDETPIIDCSGAKFFADNGALNDIYVAGLRFENARTDVANSHFFWITGTPQRATWYNNYFYNLGNGTAGTDNPSGIFISGTARDKYNILVKGNTFDTFTNNGPNGSFIDMYRAYNITIEENTIKNSNNQYGIWAKVTKSFVTIRANTLIENNTNGGISVHYGDAAPGQPHDHEICWNRIAFNNGNSSAVSLLIMGDAPSSINRNHYNSFIYRNTFYGGHPIIRFVGIENYKVDGNVVVSDSLTVWNNHLDIMDTLIPNIVASEASGITDSTGSLIGTSRSTYLGLAGHEVSSEYITTPKPPTVHIQ
ncbi:MAG: right-handed parallel beta-helix repeat-containing protein, partial [Candidatus Thiodiazotropha sp.]